MGQRGSRTINDCSTSWLLARWRHPDSAFEVPARRVRSEPLDQFQQSCHLFFKHSVKPHHLSLTNIFTNILWFQKHVQLYIYIYRLGILCIKWCSFLDLIFVYLYICIYTVSAFDHKSVTFHGRMKVAAVRVILWIPKLSSISLTTFWRQALITEDVCWQSAMGDRLKTSMESFFVTLSLATIQPAVVGMCSETWISYKLEPAGQWCAWSFVWSLDIVFFLKIFGSSIVRPFVVYSIFYLNGSHLVFNSWQSTNATGLKCNIFYLKRFCPSDTTGVAASVYI